MPKVNCPKSPLFFPLESPETRLDKFSNGLDKFSNGLERLETRLKPRSFWESRIENRVSSIELRGDCQLTFEPSTVNPVQWGSYLEGGQNTNTPCCNSFFSFFPSLKTAELPALCNINYLFLILRCPYLCVYLHYHINKQQNTSFEFSSILLTVDCWSSKTFNHGLSQSKINTGRQFCDFQYLLFLFWQSSNLHDRAHSGSKLHVFQ